MQSTYSNIYTAARRSAGLTQERWSEAIGCSVESVRLYESGRGLPSDDIVLRMADVSGLPALCAQHMRQKSPLGALLVPEVDERSLAQAVCTLVHRIHEFDARHRDDHLLSIAADGYVAPAEAELFAQISRELDAVIKAALDLKYAKGERYDE